ncbi:MAG: hypothetical protein MSIBF_07295 [Candidatus Altiarchaeales archaeon IMC4]|nr:MAG: hypothetical protein MSIBF_07295 [Candidatus Altiarchaeales archaeon IMC4]
MAHFALQNTKFGSEKGKVQKPARIPPRTPPAGGKKAEAGRKRQPRLAWPKIRILKIGGADGMLKKRGRAEEESVVMLKS